MSTRAALFDAYDATSWVPRGICGTGLELLTDRRVANSVNREGGVPVDGIIYLVGLVVVVLAVLSFFGLR